MPREETPSGRDRREAALGGRADIARTECRRCGALDWSTLDKLIVQEAARGKLLSPARRRAVIDHVRSVLPVSERRACATLGQHRSTQRKVLRGPEDEERLTADMIALARQYGRYGYRKIAEFLRRAGWQINGKRVERLWRREV